jgi:hypothetical protein
MLHLARSLGFRVRRTEQNVETVALNLQAVLQDSPPPR